MNTERKDIQEKVLEISEKQDALQAQMNKDRLDVIRINNEIDNIKEQIKSLKNKFKCFADNTDGSKNLNRNRLQAVKARAVSSSSD
jgi:flagellar biosynthesis chaperone FliJ